MIILKPNNFPKDQFKDLDPKKPKVFLGGTIDMGGSEDWQASTGAALADFDGYIFNPRRDDWDSSWKQIPVPGEPFYEQVDWELRSQSICDVIIYNFLAGSQSPITLLELGLFSKSQAVKLVVCPEDYWRYGNVKIVCDQFASEKLRFYHDYDEMFEALTDQLLAWKTDGQSVNSCLHTDVARALDRPSAEAIDILLNL